jgi:hypothetical protein
MSTIIYRPYTYLIGWTQHDLWYYGCEYASVNKTANPKNLWTSYFTSSSYVQETRYQYGEPDVIQVRHIFKDAISATSWETKVLQRMKVHAHEKWLNKNVAGLVRMEMKDVTKKKISEGMILYSKKLPKDYRTHRAKNAAKIRWNNYYSDPQKREHLSKIRKMQTNPMDGKKQNRVCCVTCKKEYPVNIFARHRKREE